MAIGIPTTVRSRRITIISNIGVGTVGNKHNTDEIHWKLCGIIQHIYKNVCCHFTLVSIVVHGSAASVGIVRSCFANF